MILGILQARISSNRFPKKVLKSILGKPMLIHQIERLQNSKMIDRLIVATSANDSDDVIEELCFKNKIEVFRGHLENVLDRYYQCAILYNPKYIVRLTADCPLTDWQEIDKMINFCLQHNFDYVKTSLKYPDGLDAEIMTMNSLIEAKRNAFLKSDLEHVTQYITNRPDYFKICEFNYKKDLSNYRWTVDEPDDFILVEKIYNALYKKNPNFLTSDILSLLKKQPELNNINQRFIRNLGLQKSLIMDRTSKNNV